MRVERFGDYVFADDIKNAANKTNQVPGKMIVINNPEAYSRGQAQSPFVITPLNIALGLGVIVSGFIFFRKK